MLMTELRSALYRLVHNSDDRQKLYHYLKGLGNTNDLHTTNKDSVVGAINEVLDGGASSPMTPITYAELKALRDNGELIPGMQYRIIDYHTTTAQEDTKSADHQFDIIVIADSANVLNENARAIQHDSQKNKPTLFLERPGGDFNGEYPLTRASSEDVVIEGVSYYGWDAGDWIWYTTSETPLDNSAVYSIYDDEEVESYPVTEVYFFYSVDTYFADCNLAAWELKYSLDNDTSRFAWAFNGLPIPEGTFAYNRKIYNIYNNVDFDDGFMGFTYIRCPEKDVEGEEPYAWIQVPKYRDDMPSVSDYTEDITREDWQRLSDNFEEIFEEWSYYSAFNEFPLDTEFALYPDDTYFTHYYVGKVWNGANGGTGVIYYMKDEWNNECPYDFKNIQSKAILWGDYVDPEYGKEVYAYTCCSYNPYQGDLIQDTSLHGDVYNINIYPSFYAYEGDEPQQVLSNDLILGYYVHDVTIGQNSFDVVIEGASSNITFVCNIEYILINKCDHINIGEGCNDIVLFGSSFIDIGEETYTVDFTQVFYTKVGRSCSDLTFGVDGYYTYTQGIEVGDFCHNIRTAENFYLDCDLKIGKACNNLTLALYYSGDNYGHLLATILPYTSFDDEHFIYLNPMTSPGNYLQIIGRDGDNNRTIEYELTPVVS